MTTSYPYGTSHIVRIIKDGETIAERPATSEAEAMQMILVDAKNAAEIGASILVSPLNIDFDEEFDSEGE